MSNSNCKTPRPRKGKSPPVIHDEQRREQWLMESRKAIDAYNEHVEQQGVFSDGLRSF